MAGTSITSGGFSQQVTGAIVAFNDGSGNPVPVSAAAPLPVTAIITLEDGTAISNAAVQTITLGGTAQSVFTANAIRTFFFIVNTSDTIMYVDDTGATATSASLPLRANGGYYEPHVAPTGAISLLCATTGKTFVAKQG